MLPRRCGYCDAAGRSCAAASGVPRRRAARPVRQGLGLKDPVLKAHGKRQPLRAPCACVQGSLRRSVQLVQALSVPWCGMSVVPPPGTPPLPAPVGMGIPTQPCHGCMEPRLQAPLSGAIAGAVRGQKAGQAVHFHNDQQTHGVEGGKHPGHGAFRIVDFVER